MGKGCYEVDSVGRHAETWGTEIRFAMKASMFQTKGNLPWNYPPMNYIINYQANNLGIPSGTFWENCFKYKS